MLPNWTCRIALLAALVFLTLPATARDENLSPEDRVLLMRDLSSEYATAKVILPRSKDALVIDTNGDTEEAEWITAQGKWGPAAQVGDLIQITKIEFEDERIVFVINNGYNGGRKWWQKIQMSGGMGGPSVRQTQVGPDGTPMAASGTKIALKFDGPVPRLDADEIRKLLSPLIDFEQRTASEQFFDTLPEPVQAAVKEERAIEGMDTDMVLLAMGKPVRKVRETKEGIEYEDWIYGEPPGKMTFVTFRGSKVVEVREMYAGAGGSVAPPLEPTR